jgi:quercetin dioxygenase-like cupin family protein
MIGGIKERLGGNAMLKTSVLVAVAASALAIGGFALAQQMAPPGGQMAPPAQTAGVKRIPLQKGDVPAGDRETVMGIAEVAPNTDVARPTHPGPEFSYILEGEVMLAIGDQPAKPFKAGDSYYVPQGTPHGGRAGSSGVKILSAYIVEKGKPLASPAP